jgi:hypothetical protein
MHQRPARLLLTIPMLAIAVAACGPAGTSTAPSGAPTVAPSEPVTSEAPSPVMSAAPVEPGTSAAPTTGQTDTDWGRIWDAVPAGFPAYPGSTIADDAGVKDASVTWAIDGGDAHEIATWYQHQLEQATYSTEALSGPMEDGGYVLDSVGEAGCRIEVSIAPTGSLTLVAVKYGAACPNV